MSGLPEHLPKTQEEAFAHLGKTPVPTVDEFKLMVYLEASGQGFYSALAEVAPNAEIKELLEANGREEMAHATRLVRVIKTMTGEDFAIPAPGENPYYSKPEGVAVTAELLGTIAEGEYGGEALYDAWASTLDDEASAKLLRQNGVEETRHGDRATQAIELLKA